MPNKNRYEKQFFDALRDIFVGANVEGDSGFINLMRIKARYYEHGVFPHLKKDIDTELTPFPDFREELFDKLYTFFSRYFSESGSIYFRHTPSHQNIYEKVYTDDRDVMIFWKTHMLYYVKTDRIFTSLKVEVDQQMFYFDAGQMTLKRSNEKREVIYSFRKVDEDGTLTFDVEYSERGRTTKVDEILREIKQADITLDEDTLTRAFRVFEKQSEVDYFINKNAKVFLEEQFDLWMYQYVFEGQNVWKEERLAQLQTLKEIAYKIIAFIAQFEDELVRIWNKPKFVLNSHYVITLDKISDEELMDRLLDHLGMEPQIKEWIELGMVETGFDPKILKEKDLAGEILHRKYQFLPLDTRYFPDLELSIIALFENLDHSLDGWLIHSENYQALTTNSLKFSGKIKACYIDPPFNLDSSDKFLYRTNYKDSNWATLLENRIFLSKEWLSQTGIIFVRCDYNGNWIVRCLLNNIFSLGNFYNELAINRIKKNVTDKGRRNIPAQFDNLIVYKKTDDSEYVNILKKLNQKRNAYWHAMDSAGIPGPRQVVIEGKTFYPPEGTHFKFPQKQVNDMYKEGRIRINPKTGKPQYLVLEKSHDNLDTNWTDIPGYAFTTGFQTENSEVLLKRVIEVATLKGDIVLDFFLGSGTTTAVAHKLSRKWVGVEMGEHFYDVALPRMKKVLFGIKAGVSKNINWEGGGFFKYFDLEQYEDTLRRAYYGDADLFHNPYEDPYHQYIFQRDEKMLDALEVDYEENKVKFHPERVYPDIDLAETLSNLRGKWIKRITVDFVEFEDGELINLKDPDWRILKPLIWW